MTQKMDIVELYEKIEAFKEADPRSKGTVNELVSLYVDVGEIIRQAGWKSWEYEATLCAAVPRSWLS